MRAVRVLVVEDEQIIVLELLAFLRDLQFEVVGCAASGEAAVAMAYRLQPDIVLMDMMLQGEMDGVEAAAAINQQRPTPTVFLTAHSDEATMRRIETVQPYGYVLKPFDRNVLRVSLRTASWRFARDQALQADMRWRYDMLDMVAHDLNNPLLGISLNSEMLVAATGARAASSQSPALLARRIATAADSMERLLRDLQDARSSEQHAMAIELGPLRVGDLLAAVRELFEPIAHSHGHRLVWRVPASDLTISGDRGRLLQLFANLLGNALKFSAAPSTVVIAARRCGAQVVFGVSDSGPGICAEHSARIFERFYKIPRDRSKPGLGLGLCVSAGIAEAHGGRLWHRSRAGQGASFRFCMPTYVQQRAAPTVPLTCAMAQAPMLGTCVRVP